MKTVNIVKVVSKNFVSDIVEGVKNTVGKNLTLYEKMIHKGVDQIKEELRINRIKLKWFRYEITQLTNGAVAIMLYGERK